jgi:exodeoxyribonuclease-3
MRIATWNVNSVRARLDHIRTYLVDHAIDVLAIQETKVAAANFPAAAFAEIGYTAVATGSNHWNGVAILSRIGADDAATSFPGQPPFGDPPVIEGRALGVICGGIRVWSLYVPHGRALDHPHMAYKLAWLGALAQAAADWLRADPAAPIALLGDWNVAPLDTDVWDMADFDERTHVSPPERAALAAFDQAGYEEVSRRFVPAEHQYTNWDYQAARFRRNQGMRIDFAYCSPALAARVTAARIIRAQRSAPTPSDHVPVELDVMA